jgi:hypothetical protein
LVVVVVEDSVMVVDVGGGVRRGLRKNYGRQWCVVDFSFFFLKGC